MNERFVYWLSPKDEKWHFQLIDENNNLLAQSRGYPSKEDCVQGIDVLKNLAPRAETFEKLEQ